MTLDINLNIGVSDKEGEMDFYIMADTTLSTFSKVECDQLIKSGKKLASIEQIKVMTIEKLLEQYFDHTAAGERRRDRRDTFARAALQTIE